MLMFHGLLEAKNPVMYMVCLCGISYISNRFEFKPKYFYYFFACCVVPLGMYNMAVSGNVTWIPVDGVINIIGGESTKHGTALAGLFMLIPTLCYLFEKHRGMNVEYSNRKLYAILLFSIYLIVFSSSRSVTLGAILLIAFLYINRNRFRKILSVFIFIAANASVYFMELLQNYVGYLNTIPVLAEFAHTDNFEQYGVTTGRAWLWGVHMEAFLRSTLWMGGGREVVDFTVGDWIGSLNMVAKAGSESTYTGYMACYGLVGVCLILIELGLFFHAAKMRNTMAAAIVFCITYNTTMGTSLDTPYNTFGIFAYLFYFLYMNRGRQYACLQR